MSAFDRGVQSLGLEHVVAAQVFVAERSCVDARLPVATADTPAFGRRTQSRSVAVGGDRAQPPLVGGMAFHERLGLGRGELSPFGLIL
jgi:hypothetical protein